MHKNKFIEQIVNNIQLTQNLTCVLRIYNSMVRFSKYVVMLIFFSLSSSIWLYNKICSQTLSFYLRIQYSILSKDIGIWEYETNFPSHLIWCVTN